MLRNTVQISNFFDSMIQQMCYQMRAYCVGEHHTKSIKTIRAIPASVWDHFKWVYFPVWFRKLFRMVIRWERRDVTVNASNVYMCPHADLPWNSRTMEHHVRFTKMGKTPIDDVLIENAYLKKEADAMQKVIEDLRQRLNCT